MSKNICFVAGGTAGHINSALAMGEFYQKKGFHPIYISGDRPLDFKLLPEKKDPHFSARPLVGRNLKTIISSLVKNFFVFLKAISFLKNNRPVCVVGAGGYICGPVLMAAYFLRIPLFIIEQNGVLGLTNRLLLPFVKKVFFHFQATLNQMKNFRQKGVVTGNPIRDIRLGDERNLPYKSEVNIVIFGGSLGAKAINDLVKKLVEENHFDRQISIIHQVGLGNRFPTRVLDSNKVIYQQLEYLDKIYAYYNWADLIICRAGASTISELRVFKKSAILIPYPNHADRQQYFNAESLKIEADFNVKIIDEKDDFEKKGLAIIQEMIEYCSSNKRESLPDMSSILKTKELIFKEINNALY